MPDIPSAQPYVFLLLFLIIEWRLKYPLLNLRLLHENLEFSFSNLATFLNYASITSFILLFSLYLQYVKGFSPKQAGMIIIVQPVVQAILAPLVGRLSDRFPPARIATIGMGMCTIGLLSATWIGVDTALSYIFLILILLGLSLGLFSTPNMIVIMGSVEAKDLGTAASMVSTMRTTGMLCSATVIALLIYNYLGDAAINPENVGLFVSCIHNSLYLFAALSFLGTIFSMTTRGRFAIDYQNSGKKNG